MWGPDPPPSSMRLPGSSSWAGGDSWCEEDETDELSRSRKGGYYDLGGGGTPPSRSALALGWNRGRGGGGAIWDAWGNKEDLSVEGPLHSTTRPPSLSAGGKGGRKESYVSLGSGTPRSAVFPCERDPGIGIGIGVAAAREIEGRESATRDPPFFDAGAEAVGASGPGVQDQYETRDEERRRQRRSNSGARSNSNRGSLGRRSSSGNSSRVKPLTQYSPW